VVEHDVAGIDDVDRAATGAHQTTKANAQETHDDVVGQEMVRASFADSASRRLPGPWSFRLVTVITRPPRPPGVAAP
jgi:hypothetical protein